MILLYIFLTVACFKSLFYLYTYKRLKRKGIKAEATITQVKESWWFGNIPTISFTTNSNVLITNKPVRPLYPSAAGYSVTMTGHLCIVYYDPKSPDKFVTKSYAELRANYVFVGLMLCALILKVSDLIRGKPFTLW